jgi:lysophospholipase L1-like esterase
MSFRRLPSILVLQALLASACGGGSGGPSTPSTPPPDPTYPVSVVVFYDQDGNGLLDPATEPVRMPGAEVVAGSATAKTEKGTGRAVIQATAGTQTVAIRAESLPPYWVPTAGVTVTVPGAPAEVQLPVRLPIGDNQPNVYVAFGDSLTIGQGSSTGGGYRDPLQAQLTSYFGQAFIVNSGRDGTFSTTGAARIPGVMSRERPAYTLILYGTNDWNDQRCQTKPPAECYTIDNLRTIVEYVKGVRSYPVLATLPPTNPALAPIQRTAWNAELNTLIKSLAQSEGAILADLFAAFPTSVPSELPRFFSDDVHPNDQGYALMAQAFLKALTTSRSGTPGPTDFGGGSGFAFVRPSATVLPQASTRGRGDGAGPEAAHLRALAR